MYQYEKYAILSIGILGNFVSFVDREVFCLVLL